MKLEYNSKSLQQLFADNSCQLTSIITGKKICYASKIVWEQTFEKVKNDWQKSHINMQKW